MPPISDLVRDSKLETTFHREYTQHVYYVSGATPHQRKVRREESWRRDKYLGTGAAGIVWLEKLDTENGEVQHRAVKEIRKSVQKSKAVDYSRELEAIAKFSHPKYESCFVKSLGWYENSMSVFIAMEYFPLGDLESCLTSPIPEEEGRQITSQILEGLLFMHENGFAHRDLKLTNILVKYQGPDWWVKIGDFGISKRAEEGLTALRTLSGTPGFLAPEVLVRLGIFDNAFEFSEEYTVAVDIWSLGEITFRILTGEQPFRGPGFGSLRAYVKGASAFPEDVLRAHGVSNEGCDMLKSLMAPIPTDRLTAKEASRHKWIESQKPSSAWSGVERQRPSSTTEDAVSSLEYPTIEASARWTTLDGTSTIFQSNSPANAGSIRKSPATWRQVHSTVAESNPDASEKGSTFGEVPFQSGTVSQRIPDGEEASTTYFLLEGTTNNLDMAPQGTQNQRVQETTDVVLANNTVKESKELDMPLIESKNSGLTQQPPAARPKAQSLVASLAKLVGLARPVSPVPPVSQQAHRVLEGHSALVNDVAFSPDGKLVASGSDDMTVMLWDSATGSPRLSPLGHLNSVHAVAFSPDGKLVASGSNDKTVRLWDSATGSLRHKLVGHSAWVYAVDFSPDGKLVASGSGDKTVRLWDSVTGSLRHKLVGHLYWVSDVAFSPDGKLVASGSVDHTVRLWDSATGSLRHKLVGHSDGVCAVAFSPDGKLVASGSRDKTVRLWDLATGSPRHKLRGHSNWVCAVAFSPDGKLVASGSADKTVRLWDSATGSPHHKLVGHSNWVRAVAFSPDGKLVASGSHDMTVRLWDLGTEAA